MILECIALLTADGLFGHHHQYVLRHVEWDRKLFIENVQTRNLSTVDTFVKGQTKKSLNVILGCLVLRTETGDIGESLKHVMSSVESDFT